MKIIILLSILLLGGCSYKAHFYELKDSILQETGKITANAKGVYKKGEMSADFGKPVISLGNIAPKFEGN